jgi:hypothetical protein
MDRGWNKRGLEFSDIGVADELSKDISSPKNLTVHSK